MFCPKESANIPHCPQGGHLEKSSLITQRSCLVSAQFVWARAMPVSDCFRSLFRQVSYVKYVSNNPAVRE